MDSQPWSFLFKEESMACHITSQFNNKLGRFSNKIKKVALLNQPYLLLNWEVMCRACLLKSSMVKKVLLRRQL